MKKFISMSVLLLALGGLLAACGSGSSDDQVKVSDVWTRTTAPGQTTGAIYATLESNSDNELTGAGVPDGVAGKVELHETGGAMPGDEASDEETSGDEVTTGSTGENGAMGDSGGAMMSMTPVSSIALPENEQVNLEPGGYHIMLLDLSKPIKAGESIPVTLSFENGDDITVDATAREG